MSSSRAAFVDDSNDTRLSGELVYAGATPDDVLTVQADGSIAAAPSGGSSASIPQATAGTVDTDTYGYTVLVFPADQNAIAIAIEGDAFPRLLITSDPADGIYLGDGTGNPFNGANIWIQSGALRFKGVDSVKVGGNGADNAINVGILPVSDPEVSGLLWNDEGVVKVSA